MITDDVLYQILDAISEARNTAVDAMIARLHQSEGNVTDPSYMLLVGRSEGLNTAWDLVYDRYREYLLRDCQDPRANDAS